MTIETTKCAFCGYQNCHPIQLEPTKLFQHREGFLCPNCGAMSVWGGSEETVSANVLGLRPVPSIFPSSMFYSPFEEPFFYHFAWPGFVPFWHDPFPSLIQGEDLQKLKEQAKLDKLDMGSVIQDEDLDRLIDREEEPDVTGVVSDDPFFPN